MYGHHLTHAVSQEIVNRLAFTISSAATITVSKGTSGSIARAPGGVRSPKVAATAAAKRAQSGFARTAIAARSALETPSAVSFAIRTSRRKWN